MYLQVSLRKLCWPCLLNHFPIKQVGALFPQAHTIMWVFFLLLLFLKVCPSVRVAAWFHSKNSCRPSPASGPQVEICQKEKGLSDKGLWPGLSVRMLLWTGDWPQLQTALSYFNSFTTLNCIGEGRRKVFLQRDHPFSQRKVWVDSPLSLGDIEMKDILNTNWYEYIYIYIIELIVNRLFCIPEHAVVLYAL